MKPSNVLNRRGDAALIGPDDLPQILGIEPRREGGGAHQIAEHDAERAALGVVSGEPAFSRRRTDRKLNGFVSRRVFAAQLPDRFDQLAAVAD